MKILLKYGEFDGILICTYLDGTLLKNDKTISEENTNAIEYFKHEGGYFTIVTGRMPFFTSYILDVVKPNALFCCINGGGQFIILFIGGLFAPGQGVLPNYYDGLYELGKTKMIVSRGIGHSSFPFRLNNKPVIVVAKLMSSTGK